ncbi:MAG TPA: DNA repair protein RecN [Acidimicrobiales bacterium]|nr:DNA repair protein RecN [Acidimicrobiales bacterium]
MLTELRVRDLGVIADLRLVLGAGMTALTGETGAGKTLVVEAIELLMGGRADRVLVRPGADEAWVEGRFVDGDDEVVLARAIPSGTARARAYIDGKMAPVAALAERGGALVDLHGQHAHQSLLAPSVQRAALDAFGGVDLKELADARHRLREIDQSLAALGGDARARAREVDLLRFQLEEIEAAAVVDVDEVDRLAAEDERLSSARESREAAAAAHDLLLGEAGVVDRLGDAVAAVGGLAALKEITDRLRGLQAEVADAAHELRDASETIEDDPERLALVQARRAQLRELCRKYGDTLTEVAAFEKETRARLDELESHETRVAQLEADRVGAVRAEAKAAAAVAEQRRKAAPDLAREIEQRLRQLALPAARIEIEVRGNGPADDVTFLFAANPGEPPLPLTKIASGGELARTMLAARLVLTAGPPTLVFDEVDAGIGGAAAVAVGKSLGALAATHQVLVVTHLPQVAAYADAHVSVTKAEKGGRTVASASLLDDAARVVELSRMLSGQPASSTARDHAEELLATAARERGR